MYVFVVFLGLLLHSNLSQQATAPKGLTVHARAEAMRSPAWTAPTLIGGSLYVRDWHTIAALDIGR